MSTDLPITDAVVSQSKQVPVVAAKPKSKKPEAKEKKEPPEKKVEIKVNTVEIPTGPLPGYIKRRVDVGRMTREQSENLGKITSGLQFEQAKLKNGSPVKSAIHAVRWILENLK